MASKAKKEEGLNWRAQPVKTVEDLVDALTNIVTRGNPHEARWFAERYGEQLGSRRKADENIGYCLGYLNRKRMIEGLALFNVSHPVFGSAAEAKKIRSPKQFLDFGREIAKASAFDGKVIRKGG